MAEVPYLPVGAGTSEVPLEPSTRSFGPRLEVGTTPAMFGANVGEAMEHVGGDLQKSGDEVFQAAMQIQKLNNDNTARAGTDAAFKQIAPLQANFRNLTGPAAQQQLMPYLNQVSDIINKNTAGMSPQARQMYLQDMSAYKRSLTIEAATHSGAEFKSYTKQTIDATSKNLIASVVKFPTDDAGFANVVAGLKQQAIAKGAVENLGPDDPNVVADADAQISAATRMRILASSKNAAYASQLFEQAKKDGTLIGKDFDEAQAVVFSALDHEGAVSIAHNTLNGNYWAQQTTVPTAVARIAFGTEESGNNYRTVGVMTKYGQALGRYAVMEKLLPDFWKEAGMTGPVPTREQFLNDMHMQDQLFDTLYEKWTKEGKTFGQIANRWFSGTFNEKAAQDVLGTTQDKYRAIVSGYVATIMGRLRSNTSISAKADAARKQAYSISPGNDDFADHAVNQTLYQYNLDKRVKQDDANIGVQNITKGMLQYYNQHAATYPSDIQELRESMPNFDIEWNKLEPKTQKMIQDTLASPKQKTMTNEMYKNYIIMEQKLKHGTPEEQQEILDTPAITQPWPPQFIEKFMNMQERVKNSRNAFPQTTEAMRIIDPILADPSVGIQKGSDDYRMIQQITEDRLEDYAHTFGKRMPPDEVKKLGYQVTYEVAHGFLGVGRELFIQQNPPPEISSAIEAEMKKQGFTPTEEMVRRVYLHQLLREETAKPKPKPSASVGARTEGVPTLPMSQ